MCFHFSEIWEGNTHIFYSSTHIKISVRLVEKINDFFVYSLILINSGIYNYIRSLCSKLTTSLMYTDTFNTLEKSKKPSIQCL